MPRKRSLVAALAAAAMPAAPAAAAPGLSRTERAVVARVNEVRAAHGLAPLTGSRALNRAADDHSADMRTRGFFAHESSDGSTFAQRLRRYTGAATLGETLAALTPAGDRAGAVVRMWLDSPPHRAVLLTAGFRRVGVAARTAWLGGVQMTVVTADFSSRS